MRRITLPTLDAAVARKVLVGFVRDEIRKVGLKKAVLGLSGGIDSALSCFIAAEALGPENVLAVRMPYRTSSQGSLDHAQLVIDQLGVQSETVEITEMVDGWRRQSPGMAPLRAGNIMARCRMITLYDRSSVFGGLVVGTGNKTELMLGYTTLFGDQGCALNPIGDLFKTQIRALSAEMNVPRVIIDKAPSADLWEGQTDEQEMGLSYDEVDQLLHVLVDLRYSLEEAVDLGFDVNYVNRIWRMVSRNQFKRRYPLIAKVSGRTVGADFLYPRDWGV